MGGERVKGWAMPVFPSVLDPTRPISLGYARDVLHAAEALAMVEPVAGHGDGCKVPMSAKT